MTTYEILSLIIGGIGSIATFSAVVVALWQIKYSNRKKLKCKFIEHNAVCSSSVHKNYVCMDITNIGNKKVIIKSWGIKRKNGYIMILTSGFEKDAFDKIVAVKTPYHLDVEENVSFFYDKNLFPEVIDDAIKKSEIEANKKICFVVYDSTGRAYYTKSKDIAKTYIKNNNG